MSAVAESAPATSAPTASTSPAPSAAPASGSGSVTPSPVSGNPLAAAIGSETNQNATDAALAQATESAKPVLDTGAEASAVDGEGDTDPSSAAESAEDAVDNDAVIDAVQQLLARGVTRAEISKVKDPAALVLLSRLTGGEASPAQSAGGKDAGGNAEEAAPFAAPELSKAVAKFAETMGFGEDQHPAINDFAQALTAPLNAKVGQAIDALRSVVQFVEKREIDRASAPLIDRYPKLKTADGKKALTAMLGKMNGGKFADYDTFVAAAADAAFAGDWLTQKIAERAKLNAAKGRSRAVVTEAAPKTYTSDELATIRADMVIAGKSPDQVRQHIERLTNRKG